MTRTKMNLRDELLNELGNSLIGPAEAEGEMLRITPITQYIVGVLFPENTPLGVVEDFEGGEGEGDGEDGSASPVSVNNVFRPSSMGMTISLEEEVHRLDVRLSWAVYEAKVEGKSRFFKRKDMTRSETLDISKDGRLVLVKEDDSHSFDLVWEVYPSSPGGARLVGLFLVNRQRTLGNPQARGFKGDLSLRCIFSPVIEVHSAEGCILARDRHIPRKEPDLASFGLLYRDRHEFATGHGCSVEWDSVDGKRCRVVRTTFMPKYDWRPLILDECPEGYGVPKYRILDVVKKASESPTALSEHLAPLVEGYERWMEETFSPTRRDVIMSSFPNESEAIIGETFDRHHRECESSLGRMRVGLGMLGENGDQDAREAFLFMNMAMFLQRAMHENVIMRLDQKDRCPDPKGFLGSDGLGIHWRPFQLAFILQTIPDIVMPENEFHDCVDLLWVPTGGGKTEAYLGLSVFSMAYRRLRYNFDPTRYPGVNVIMRYTLRLLTLQQFQRIVALMCACEYIRNELQPGKWGDEPFSAGLYVGEGTTPNKIGSEEEYRRFKEKEGSSAAWALGHYKPKSLPKDSTENPGLGVKPEENNPFQLNSCPWCGKEFTFSNFDIDFQRKRLLNWCNRDGCSFHKENKRFIPAMTVDEEIYFRLPSIVVATVDKFARLPLNPNVGKLFGLVQLRCDAHGYLTEHDMRSGHGSYHGQGKEDRQYTRGAERLPPPDLVIQDELHLINGELGSMVGIYETSIDLLCRPKDGGGPKIIASTATIRRASGQIKGLFDRDFRRFPSPGTDFGDSFFVREAESKDGKGPTPKRYVGMFPSGIGQKTIMKRVMQTLLEKGKEFKDAEPGSKNWDDYWTVVSYFNSIRELGSSKSTIEDDVQKNVGARGRLDILELTSRIRSRELSEVLDKMFSKATEGKAVDVVVCSNMFSVGVDVTRLGMMIMNNQPKSTAEYIQSTGRVGRGKDGCGLILVLYNWNRPRDQSHFERFYDYHNRIQRHVEAMTVTPFSEGARTRALHAQYVSLLRLLKVREFQTNEKAKCFDGRARSSSKGFEADILGRVARVAPDSRDDAEAQLDMFLRRWMRAAGRQEDFRYHYPYHDDRSLMKTDYDEGQVSYLPYPTPNTMRAVEEMIPLHRVEFPMEDD